MINPVELAAGGICCVALLYAGSSFLSSPDTEGLAIKMAHVEDHFLMDSAYEMPSSSEDVSRSVVILPKDFEELNPMICFLKSDGSFTVDTADDRTLDHDENIRNAMPQFCERVFEAAQKSRGEGL